MKTNGYCLLIKTPYFKLTDAFSVLFVQSMSKNMHKSFVNFKTHIIYIGWVTSKITLY